MARADSPFSFFVYNELGSDGLPELVRFHNTSQHFAYAGFGFDEFLPFTENAFWKNFLFSSAAVYDSGELRTGVREFFGAAYVTNFPAHYFSPANFIRQINQHIDTSPVLNPTDSQWFYTLAGLPNSGVAVSQIGLSSGTVSGVQKWIMSNNTRNLYGLLFKSCKLAYANTSGQLNVDTILAGGNIPYKVGYWYPETEQPQLQTIDYYFAPRWQHVSPDEPDFNPTNTSPLIIAAVGETIKVSGWAKQAITNGYSNKFAYLEQYFDKAYKMDVNGNVTTNETGILSPYGEFFPTEPGPVALVTMPDIETGQRGTGTVHVIKLELDVNHDGTIDHSFAGPDNTSAQKPFTFWWNNDFDRGSWVDFNTHFEFDDMENGDSPGTPRRSTPDYGYLSVNHIPTIPTVRDLEDYTRLWITGLSNIVSTLPSGSKVELSWAYAGDPGNPTINIFKAFESPGGIGYLTNSVTASNQIDSVLAPFVGTLGTSDVLQLNECLFGDCWRGDHFIFCGAAPGKGELRLTVKDPQDNVLAESSVFVEIKNITNMFEKAVAINVTSNPPPSSLVSQFTLRKTLPKNSLEPKQMIVFVHGINNTEFSYESTSETMFKRLYWSGYQGRFAAFRWPCAYLPPNTANPYQYNKGEFYAWKSAAGFKDYLTYLRNNTNRLAGYSLNIFAHSQGNVVASEAIKQGAPFDNYILTQAAIPAQCYDTNVPFLPKLLTAEEIKPTPLYATNGGYHGYFSGISGRLINFYNTNDFALASGTTPFIGETNWEENQRTKKPEFFGDPLTVYGYDTNTGTSFRNTRLTTGVLVTDLHEAKAMVARSRSRALGAQQNIGGIILNTVDLKEQFGISNTRPEHSAQFTRDIQNNMRQYYRQVLTSFQIQPAP